MLLSRCMLFTFANLSQLFNKAKELNADGLIIALENVISFDEKNTERCKVLNRLSPLKQPNFQCCSNCICINFIAICASPKYLSMLCDKKIWSDILVFSNLKDVRETKIINIALKRNKNLLMSSIDAAREPDQRQNVAQIPNILDLVSGDSECTVDICHEKEWTLLLHILADIAWTAAVAGILAVDAPYLQLHDFNDSHALAEAEKLEAMSLACNLASPSKHIRPILDTLTLTDKEAAHAQRVVPVYESTQGEACE